MAWTRIGTTAQLYVNGRLAANTTGVTLAANGSGARIACQNPSNEKFNGKISNLRIVKGTALYTADFVPSTTPLTAVANTTLLACATSSIKDISPSNVALTPIGVPKIFQDSPFDKTPIQANVTTLGSAFFDGTGDYLTIPYHPSFNIPASTPFTFECWVYTTSTAFFPIINRNWNYGSSGPTYSFSLNNGTTPSWGIAGTGSATYVMMPNGIAGTLGQWNHYVFCRDDSNVCRMFTNGVEALSSTRTDSQAMTASSGSMYIGVSSNLASPYANGQISKLRFVVGSCLYTESFVPPTAPLTAIANTSLLTCQSNSFIDNSTNAFTITKSGDAKITTLQPFAANNTSRFSSVYFAAKTDYLAIEPDPTIVRFPGDFTFECWVYPTLTTTTFWGIWDSRNAGATANPLAFSLDPLASAVAGSYRMSYYNGTKYYGTTTVLWNQWTHVAWVRSGTTMTFYVNGVAGGTATISGAQIGNVTSTPIYIGSKDNNLTNYGTNGYISDLRITNGYARTITVPTTPYDIK